MNRVPLLLRRAYFVLSALLLSCDAGQSVSTWTKDLVSDRPSPAPISITVACDNSLGSTCGQVELAANIEAALQIAVNRPHSAVAVWSFGADVSSTHELAHVESPEASTRGDRARVAQQRQ